MLNSGLTKALLVVSAFLLLFDRHIAVLKQLKELRVPSNEEINEVVTKTNTTTAASAATRLLESREKAEAANIRNRMEELENQLSTATSQIANLTDMVVKLSNLKMKGDPVVPGVQEQVEAVKESQPSSASTPCYPHYSQNWLESPRHGNIAKNGSITEDPIVAVYTSSTGGSKSTSAPVLEHIDILMGETLAWPTSALANHKLGSNDYSNNNDSATNFKVSQQWMTRLAFAVIHQHQHKPAQAEWQWNTDNTNTKQQSSQTQQCPHSWDCECGPDSKYLIFALQDQGIGAGVVVYTQLLLAGIVSNRIAITANAPENNPILQNQHIKPWSMASCDRKDHQCFFAPLSPCVLTQTQIINGTSLPKEDFIKLFKTAELSPDNDQKVIMMSYRNFGAKVDKEDHMKLTRETFHSKSQILLKDSKISPNDPLYAKWDAASKLFIENPEAASLAIQRAASLYMMRPNPHYQSILHQRLEVNLAAASADAAYDPATTIGLPIRASDKCNKESTCLTFDEYMELAMETWKDYFPTNVTDTTTTTPQPPHIVLTSESKAIISKLKELQGDPERVQRYPFPFVTNDGDINPGSGRFRSSYAGVGATADDGMLSSMSTLQLQLGSRVLQANCCSAFHAIMGSYLEVGAGSPTIPLGQIHFECLNRSKDPRFRICCWKGGSCVDKRKADLKLFLANLNQTTATTTTT